MQLAKETVREGMGGGGEEKSGKVGQPHYICLDRFGVRLRCGQAVAIAEHLKYYY